MTGLSTGFRTLVRILLLWSLALTAQTHAQAQAQAPSPELLNRLTWGISPSLYAQTRAYNTQQFIEQQLHPQPNSLPAMAQTQIDAMKITQLPMQDIVADFELRRRSIKNMPEGDDKARLMEELKREERQIAEETATRHLLRAIYSNNQVLEQMVWFWGNHFSVFQNKADIRLMTADYEENAIRPFALGRFRDLLGAVAHHPAMLRYLDNQRNARGQINENYARELMELHTLGLEGGYTQEDVQELARVLTGHGVNFMPGRQAQSLQKPSGYEFNPRRHDFEPKRLLGNPIRGQGEQALEEALDILAKHPSTARFISRKLAQFWLQDKPSERLVDRMAQSFSYSQGEIAEVLRTLFYSDEFKNAKPQKIKDPMRYIVSAVRLNADTTVLVNSRPMIAWLQQLGEPLFGRTTPDGYPLTSDQWSGSGQLSARFEMAKALSSNGWRLFRQEGQSRNDTGVTPTMNAAFFNDVIDRGLSEATRQVLSQAGNVQERTMLFLSSPEFMQR